MKNRLKGFVEGTTNVTTGDRIKPGDHVRHKSRCFSYSNGWCKHYARKCTGSSHCDYYNDGIKVQITDEEIPNLHTHQKLLISWIQEELKNKINYKSLEGKLLIELILKNNFLSYSDLIEAERQIVFFNKEKMKLIKEIEEFNRALKKKCILIGLLLITAPFCYAHYKNNVRDINRELESLEKKIINKDLQKKVKTYNAEVANYKKLSNLSKPEKCSYNDKNVFFVRAKIEYKHKRLEKFFEMISKSIKEEKNIGAILFLAQYFKQDCSDIKNKQNRLLLLLYASYLGDKSASIVIRDILLTNNPKSTLAQKFAEKIGR